jgi:hypothetical protein
MNNIKVLLICFIVALWLALPHASSIIGGEVPPHVSHTLLMIIPDYANPVAVAKMFAQLATFQYTIPGILSYSAGPYSSNEHINHNYTHAFNMIFVNTSARDAYLVNPIHIAIGPYFDAANCSQTLGFDYLIPQNSTFIRF